VRYDKTNFEGPPRCVLEEDMEAYFSKWASYEVLENTLIPKNSSMRQVSGDMGPEAYEIIYHLKNL